MIEVKQKVMCQQDTKAAKSCTNRCPNRKKIKTNIKTMNDLNHHYTVKISRGQLKTPFV